MRGPLDGPRGGCGRDNTRLALTLPELLVALAVLSLLLALALPAVQKVRAAADRLRCQSNARQLALAYHGHQDAYGEAPRGMFGPWEYPGPVGQLGPFLEHVGPAYYRTPAPAVLRCPARRGLPYVSDYALNGGPLSAPGCFDGHCGGVVTRTPLAPPRLADFDSTSATLLGGETRRNRRLYGAPTSTTNEGWAAGWDWDVVRALQLPPAPDWSGPNVPETNPQGWAFGGPHAGGWVAAYADGHVGFRGY